jgi:hypothetical protein
MNLWMCPDKKNRPAIVAPSWKSGAGRDSDLRLGTINTGEQIISTGISDEIAAVKLILHILDSNLMGGESQANL